MDSILDRWRQPLPSSPQLLYSVSIFCVTAVIHWSLCCQIPNKLATQWRFMDPKDLLSIYELYRAFPHSHVVLHAHSILKAPKGWKKPLCFFCHPHLSHFLPLMLFFFSTCLPVDRTLSHSPNTAFPGGLISAHNPLESERGEWQWWTLLSAQLTLIPLSAAFSRLAPWPEQRGSRARLVFLPAVCFWLAACPVVVKM